MISPNLEECLKQHRFKEMFIDDLGWDNFNSIQELDIGDQHIRLESVAEKRGLRVFCCNLHRTSLANRGLLRLIQKQLIRQHHEHIIVYHSDEPLKQVWQWAIHQSDGRKVRHREHPFLSCKPPQPLLERLSKLRFTMEEEENATLVSAMTRTRLALDVIPEQEMFARLPSYAKQSDELAVAMRAGEPGAFDRFCEYHLQLAKKSSRMLYHWFGIDEDDAFQIAQTFTDLERNDWDSLRSIKEPRKPPIERLMLRELRQAVLNGIGRLNQREQMILHQRYGIGCEEQTLEEVAAIYGLTRERIRQIQSRAEEKLQIYLSQLDSRRESAAVEDLVEGHDAGV